MNLANAGINPHPVLEEVPWETRNLSMPAFELTGMPELRDTFLELLEKTIPNCDEDYFVQTRISSQRTNLIQRAQEFGFRLAEMSIEPWVDLSHCSILHEYNSNKSHYQPRLLDANAIRSTCVAVNEVSPDDKSSIIEISRSVFTADRFHMDPGCSREVADNRMGLWVEHDLFNDKANQCSLLHYKHELVGYIIWKADNIILGGAISEKFMGKGFAKTLYIESMVDVKNGGAENISTTISVNNVGVLNLYSRLGFSFRNPLYVFHYWG